MDASNFGAIAGSLLGLLGGVVGTCFSVKNTHSPRERRFVIRVAGLCWLALGLSALGVWLFPSLRAWTWVPVCLLVVGGVPWMNRRQSELRQDRVQRR